MRTIKLGILGCGAITQYAHLPAAIKSKCVKLTALCDRRETVAKALATQYGAQEVFADHEKFLSQGDMEAVIVAVPDEFHVPLAIDCLKSGKHILVEKPVALSIEEAKRLSQIAIDCQRVVLVGNMKRHDPGIQFARQFVVERLGALLSVNGWYCDTKLRRQLQETLLLPTVTDAPDGQSASPSKKNPVSYNLITHGIHLVNTLQFLGGPIVRLAGKTAARFDANSWQAVVEYASGAIGHFELTVKINADWSEGFEAHGENGSVTGKTFLPFFKRSSEVKAFDIRAGITQSPVAPDSDPYKRQLDSFARSIAENEPIACSVADAIQDLRVIEALKNSIKTSNWAEV